MNITYKRKIRNYGWALQTNLFISHSRLVVAVVGGTRVTSRLLAFFLFYRSRFTVIVLYTEKSTHIFFHIKITKRVFEAEIDIEMHV